MKRFKESYKKAVGDYWDYLRNEVKNNRMTEHQMDWVISGSLADIRDGSV